MAKSPTAFKVASHRKTADKPQITLTSDMVEGFQRLYLWDKFDTASETPQFHRDIWTMTCSAYQHVALAAPRGHAKSTSVTFTYAIVVLMFRVRDYMILVSDSETQAINFLRDIRIEFHENEAMREHFRVKQFIKDTETEFEVEFQDGHLFRIVAKGSEQRIRGLKWRNKRPNIILGDDLEFDEIVMNPERRTKFKDWFYKQLLPAGSKDCIYRIVGTILHTDSLLANLMEESKTWHVKLWRAHAGFDDFSEILWPERFDEAHWRKTRQIAIDAGKQDAYAQEYLNQPIAEGHSLFAESDMLEIPSADILAFHDGLGETRNTLAYCSVDLAASVGAQNDRTVFTTALMGSDEYLDIIDVRGGRLDPKVVCEMFFEVAETYQPELFIVEQGAIQRSILPYLNELMAKRKTYLQLHFMGTMSHKSKVMRSGAIRARMKAHRVRFDKECPWWQWVRDELLAFPRGNHDDVVDTLSQLGLALDDIIVPPSPDDVAEEDYWAEERAADRQGRNPVTGY